MLDNSDLSELACVHAAYVQADQAAEMAAEEYLSEHLERCQSMEEVYALKRELLHSGLFGDTLDGPIGMAFTISASRFMI